MLRFCWIDIYLGLPNNIIHNIRKNFVSVEFRQQAASLVISIKEILVKAYNSVGKIKHYHGPL
jgi:hypothetical protein